MLGALLSFSFLPFVVMSLNKWFCHPSDLKSRLLNGWKEVDIFRSLPLFDSDHVIGHVEVDVMTKIMGRLNFPKTINLPGTWLTSDVNAWSWPKVTMWPSDKKSGNICVFVHACVCVRVKLGLDVNMRKQISDGKQVGIVICQPFGCQIIFCQTPVSNR